MTEIVTIWDFGALIGLVIAVAGFSVDNLFIGIGVGFIMVSIYLYTKKKKKELCRK